MEKQKKKKVDDRTIAKLYFFVSLLWYIAAIVAFLNDNPSEGATHTCLGSTWLCIASVYLKKANDEKDKK